MRSFLEIRESLIVQGCESQMRIRPMKFSIVTIRFHAVGDLAVLGARQRHKTQIKVGGLMVGFAIFEIQDQLCVCCHNII